MRIDRNVIVIVSPNNLRRLHHTCYFESGNGWFAHGKKKALDLRGHLKLLQKTITLSLNGVRECFPLLDISLNHINKKREARHRRKIMKNPNLRIDTSR